MKTIRIPGGWYADAAPGGKYAALVAGSHLETDTGRVQLPGENVLYLRAQWKEGRRDFAGTGHNSDQGWWYRDEQWTRHGLVAGVSPAAFEGNAVLYCRGNDRCDRLFFDGLSEINFPLATGSQGIRWSSPLTGPVTGDSTYADPSRGLFQYTDYGDVAFGEADDGVGGGCVVRFADDGVVRRVEPGRCRFVRVQRDGQEIALAMSRQDTSESVLIWLTLDDLRQMPPLSTAPPIAVTVPPAPAHLKGCGYYYRDTAFHAYLKAWGDENPAAPGTHSVILEDYALPAETRADGSTPRMIVGVGQLLAPQMPQWWPRVDAVYVAVEGDELGLGKLMEAARNMMDWRGLPRKPLLTYSGPTVYPAVHQPEDILGVQLYADRGTDPAANILAQAARYWPQIQGVPKVAVIGQAYDRLGWFTGAQCAAIQPVLYDIACRWGNCEYLLWFSDSRKGGTRDHEEMRPVHRAIWDAIKRNG